MIVRSAKYLAGSRDAPCTLRIPGVCWHEDETSAPCHASDRHTGRGIKASDLSVIDGCYRCHEVFDGRAKMPGGHIITDAEWRFYALRGLQETLERRVEMGLLTVAGFDPNATPKPAKRRARKPKGERTPVRKSRALPTGRKLQGRKDIPARQFEQRAKP